MQPHTDKKQRSMRTMNHCKARMISVSGICQKKKPGLTGESCHQRFCWFGFFGAGSKPSHVRLYWNFWKNSLCHSGFQYGSAEVWHLHLTSKCSALVRGHIATMLHNHWQTGEAVWAPSELCHLKVPATNSAQTGMMIIELSCHWSTTVDFLDWPHTHKPLRCTMTDWLFLLSSLASLLGRLHFNPGSRIFKAPVLCRQSKTN